MFRHCLSRRLDSSSNGSVRPVQMSYWPKNKSYSQQGLAVNDADASAMDEEMGKGGGRYLLWWGGGFLHLIAVVGDSLWVGGERGMVAGAKGGRTSGGVE